MGSNKWVSALPAVSCASPGGCRRQPSGEAQETAGSADTHLLLYPFGPGRTEVMGIGGPSAFGGALLAADAASLVACW
eukprot:11753607-Alexandrium_andersonii.AAC.1